MTGFLVVEEVARRKAVAAGIGSDHVDLKAACERMITLCELSYPNSITFSERVLMMILGLVRNYIPSYQ